MGLWRQGAERDDLGARVKPSLFDAGPAVVKRKGSTELVLIVDCPECATPLITQTVGQAALFIHGGHGATRQTTWRVCPNGKCRWSMESVVVEVRPDVRPPRLGRE